MGYDPATCFQRLTSAGRHPCPAPTGGMSYHCYNQLDNPSIHSFCAGKDLYLPFNYSEVYNATLCGPTEYNITKCQEQTFATVSDMVNFLVANPDFKSRQCDCCCACFAWNTPIAVPKGFKMVQNFEVGDQILVSNEKFEWETQKIGFSSGTPPLPPGQQTYPTAVYVHYGEGRGLICTPDQLFLMPSGKLKQAIKLSINDYLVDDKGEKVSINSIKLAEYAGGWNHIATTLEYEGSIDGHLMNSNGVVAGDYTLQVNQDKFSDMMEGGPSIGSKEYDEAHAGHEVSFKNFEHPDAGDDVAHVPETLKLYHGKPSFIPDNANEFVTNAQAIDILSKAKNRDFSNHTGTSSVEYIFQVMRSFYPDIQYYLDWNSATPNVHAFELYGAQHVVVSGGFVRIEEVQFEALAVAIAQASASFMQPEGFEHRGLLATIYCDYFGIGTIMQSVWQYGFYDMAQKGIEQIRTIFGYISPENAKADPEAPLKYPSIECREKTMMFAQLGGGIPECVGVPVKPLLKVTGDEVGTDKDGKPTVVINFSDVLDPDTAQNVCNYILEPPVKLTEAKIQMEDASMVQLFGDFSKNTKYELTVENVKGDSGQRLDPNNNTAHFKTH